LAVHAALLSGLAQSASHPVMARPKAICLKTRGIAI